MRKLEESTRTVLFQREGRTKVATADAHALARASAPVHSAIDRLHAHRILSRGQRRPPRELRVGMGPAAGLLYGAILFEALRAVSPRSILRIVTGPAPGMLEELSAGQLDMVMAPQPRKFHDARLDSHVMYLARPAIYCRNGHPLAGASTLQEITRAKWVVAGSAGTPGNVIEEAFRVRRFVPPRIAAHCADYGMLVRLLAGTDLLGVVSHPALTPDAAGLGLHQLQLRDGLPHYDVRLFWHRSDAAGGHAAVAAVLPMLLKL
jgi:DNA-binding transcriptional LysR family regulator